MAANQGALQTFRKFFYNLSAFNQLGLRRDDTLRLTPAVVEALRRLPEQDHNERTFRIKRAIDLTGKHRVLPKEQWTKFEEDKRYLKPYIDEVEKEFSEKSVWNKM
ncbi:cytochrome b-c1 complex subunit 7-like [Antedon mediterranea]|uniref:cytochrome b-c1 complex subunit 7-like n=1 Tax=Antedon mediterranea TaxID=105859 RepID=UPI003AF9DCA4